MAKVEPHIFPLASARWLVSALLASLLLAVLGLYLTFCLLFWQGQWQLVFRPSHAVPRTPASAGLGFDKISFDSTETGVLQLSGWWVAAEENARFSQDTLLVMHDGSGSLSASLPQVEALHALGINVFVFDYRGFGESASLHPSEASTRQDAEAAWAYLTVTRHLQPSTIALDGVGLGAALAAETARRHPEAAALILENPSPPVLDLLQLDTRTHLLPVRWLFHDRFDIRSTLLNVTTPKLVLYSVNDRRYALPGAQEKAEIHGYADEPYKAAIENFLTKHLQGR